MQLTSIAVLAVSVCLRLCDVMDILTAVTTLTRWTARDLHAARNSCDAPTVTSACRKSGCVMARMTAKMGRMKRYKGTYFPYCFGK